jgi:hypothetical protein
MLIVLMPVLLTVNLTVDAVWNVSPMLTVLLLNGEAKRPALRLSVILTWDTFVFLVVLLELSVKLMPTALDPLRPVPLHNKSVLNACMIPTVEEPHPPVPPINKSVCSACVIVTALDMDPLAIMD